MGRFLVSMPQLQTIHMHGYEWEINYIQKQYGKWYMCKVYMRCRRCDFGDGIVIQINEAILHLTSDKPLFVIF